MYLDGNLLFEPTTGTALTSGTPASTNTIDLLNARDIGIGDDPALEVFVQSLAAFAGGTSINFQIQYSVDNSTWVTASESGAIPLANLTANTRIWNTPLPARPPQQENTPPRYIRMQYTIVGTFTAGSIAAGIVLDAQLNRGYAPGITISN